MAGPPDRTAAAGRPAALLMRVLGTRLRYQATRKGGTNKVSDLQQYELFTAQAEEAPGRGGRPHELAPGRHLSGLRGQHLVGILTERDLTAAIGQGADPATTPMSDQITPAPEVPGPDSELAEGQMGWHRGGFYTARWVDRLLFGQTGPAPPSWFPTYNGRWR
jgi:CBS domain-containing protein